MKGYTLSFTFLAVLELAFAFATSAAAADGTASSGPSSRRVIDRSYTLGQEQFVYVGQPLVKVKDYHETESLSGTIFKSDIPFTYHIRLVGPNLDLPAGTELRYAGERSKKGVRYTAIAIPGQEQGVLLLLDDTDTFTGMFTNILGQVQSVGDKPLIKISPRPIHFSRVRSGAVTTTDGYTNFELVYGGRNKDEMNLLYREYTSDNLARPAFTQPLTYAPEASTLRFREIAIRVVEATNEGIRYVVEQDGLPKN